MNDDLVIRKFVGGLPGTIALGICPVLMLGFAVVRSHHERILGMNALLFGFIVILAGFVTYAATAALRQGVLQDPNRGAVEEITAE